MAETRHPRAKWVPMRDAGTFAGGGPKICFHTTEGTTLAGAEAAFRNSAPHFGFNPKTDTLHQYIALNRAARTLAHPSGPETNRANVIQTELVGYAAETHEWPDAYYERLKKLTDWICKQRGIPKRCSVEFVGQEAAGVGSGTRLTGQRFFDYAGFIGHQHVPGNAHWDPGELRVNRLLK